MPVPIDVEIRRAFALAAMRREARDIVTPRQWAKANDVMLRAEKLRIAEIARHTTRYATRVETAEKRLIDEAAQPRRTLTPPGASTDRFDRTGLNLQARREVALNHQRRLMAIDNAEKLLLERLVYRVRRENAIQGAVRDAFSLAADRRRSGPHRGSGPTMN